jgi:hypothetical protein
VQSVENKCKIYEGRILIQECTAEEKCIADAVQQSQTIQHGVSSHPRIQLDQHREEGLL